MSGHFYRPGRQLNQTPDGLSNTLVVSEHYGFCGTYPMHWGQFPSRDSLGRGPMPSGIVRQATFADPVLDDVQPVTAMVDGRPATTGQQPKAWVLPVSYLGEYAYPFQVRPPLDQCDWRVPQSSLPGGILAGYGDGSARFVREGVAPHLFWGAVTPDGGESLAD